MYHQTWISHLLTYSLWCSSGTDEVKAGFLSALGHCFCASLSELSVSSPVHRSVNRSRGFPGNSVPDTDCGRCRYLINWQEKAFSGSFKVCLGKFAAQPDGTKKQVMGPLLLAGFVLFALQISLCWLPQCRWLLLGTRAMFWQRLSEASASFRSYGCSEWTGGAARGSF